jgi:hypothetical protein
MEDKTPEDVAFEKLIKRSGKQYDKIMPQADTTYGDTEIRKVPYKPGMDKGLEIQNLPLKPGMGKGIEPENLPLKPRKTKGPEFKEKLYKKGGSVSSASKRADGIAQRGKTKGTMIMCGGGYTKGK